MRPIYFVSLVTLTLAFTATFIVATTFLLKGFSTDASKVIAIVDLPGESQYDDAHIFPSAREMGEVSSYFYVDNAGQLRSLFLAVGMGAVVIVAYLFFHMYQMFDLIVHCVV